MHGRALTRLLLPVLASLAALALAAPAGAAVESCVFNAGARTVTATIETGSNATLRVGPGGAIWFGAAPGPCGAATTATTDTIAVAGTAGALETLTIDQSGGALGPGFTSETNLPEIEIALTLGDAGDELIVIGLDGNDTIAAGVNGLSLNADGDVDVTMAPQPAHIEMRGRGGVNFLSGRGGFGAGLAFEGRLTMSAGDLGDELNGGNGDDLLLGGAGPDVIAGNAGADQIVGGAGNDRLTGADGGDSITGGPGADDMLGGADNDTIDAADSEVDVQIHGGAGVDTAYFDGGLDPAPIAVENAIPIGPPPPPPGGPCAYNPVTRAVTTAVPSGGSATLRVGPGGEILFGATPVACGAATTTNTDAIAIAGTVGTTERLTIDLSGGVLGPGFSTETNIPEIEIATTLGDTSDEVTVIGTSGDDTLVVGANGVSLNADGDLDVTFSPLPARLELQGQGGVNLLTGRGGFGAGLAFAGALRLVAGDLGDEVNGGNGDDEIVGGAGPDVVNASGGNDTVYGGGGDDRLAGSDGNDVISGGPGADDMLGGNGDDTIDAFDGIADVQIHGGQGSDTIYYDAGLDPVPVASETLIDGPMPPPIPPEPPEPPLPPAPAPGACVYDASLKAVAATVPANGSASMAVVGGEILFGVFYAPCGGATVANTDSIAVYGSTTARERLVIDLSGGPFAPGATPEETGESEVEIYTKLGGPNDEIVIFGSWGGDIVAVGETRMALNGDNDGDVAFAPAPATMDIRGNPGLNMLSGQGGFGAGAPYTGKMTVFAGPDGDQVHGGEGEDLLVGSSGADFMYGHGGVDQLWSFGGADWLDGGDGNDALVAGAGSDLALIGGNGDDLLDSVDGTTDFQIDGGAGIDTAYYDALADTTPIAVEKLFPR